MQNELHFKCTDFNSSTRVTVYAECIYAFLVLIAEHRVAVTSAVTNFRSHKLIAKVNK